MKPQELRSVILFRVKSDTKGKLPMDRLYHPYEGAPIGNIEELLRALDGIYDLVVLHDPMDGCLLLNLLKNADKQVTKLPCRIHQSI